MIGRDAAHENAADRAHRRSLLENLTLELVPMKGVDDAVGALPPRSTVSVTCSPAKGIDATVELTDRLRSLGHTVVPHLAARMVHDDDHVARIAKWLRTEEVAHIFLVGGDADPALGPFVDAIAFLEALLDADPALASVGVTSYPDGHPLIPRPLLDEALHRKQDALAAAGIDGYAVTQMCFDPSTVLDWLHAERRAGLALPVHLGIPGVVDRAKLMTMGVRLGVGTSLRYLKKNRAAVGRLVSRRHYEPTRLLQSLSPALEPLGVTGLHCFTFNQVGPTVAWQQEILGRG